MRSPSVVFSLADTHRRAGHKEAAAEKYREYLVLAPKGPKAWLPALPCGSLLRTAVGRPSTSYDIALAPTSLLPAVVDDVVARKYGWDSTATTPKTL